jgi:hypothetical protein
MKSKSKERRVINIDKNDYDEIQEYCDANALNLPKWIVKIVRGHIDKCVKKTLRSMEKK